MSWLPYLTFPRASSWLKISGFYFMSSECHLGEGFLFIALRICLFYQQTIIFERVAHLLPTSTWKLHRHQTWSLRNPYKAIYWFDPGWTEKWAAIRLKVPNLQSKSMVKQHEITYLFCSYVVGSCTVTVFPIYGSWIQVQLMIMKLFSVGLWIVFLSTGTVIVVIIIIIIIQKTKQKIDGRILRPSPGST